MSTKSSELLNLQPQLELPFLKPLSSPSFQKFPTLYELANETQQTQRPREVGLFEGLLGNPAVLYEDVLKSPGKYDERVSQVLAELTSGSKNLSALSTEERGLLDQAVLDYSQVSRKPVTPTPRASVSSSTSKEKAPTRARKSRRTKAEEPRPGIDVPVTELPAFWWLR